MPDSRQDYVPALGYSWLSSLYDPVVRVTTRERRFKQELIKQASLLPGMVVLDLACGTGTLAVWVNKAEPHVELIGLDSDKKVLSIARAKAKKERADIRFEQGLATALPYDDARFDRVLSSLFFHHLNLDDKRRALAELYRVLKSNGELHIADWGRSTGFTMRLAFYFVQILDGFENTRDNVAGRLPELIGEAGFQKVRLRNEINTIFGTLSLITAHKC
jgi:ubiquinone/menaquinone biosynthesis C-methylase UbiE